MSATKTVGFVVLIGVGLYGVYYLLTKKLEAAETEAGAKIDAIGAGLKSSVAGVIGLAGAGLKDLAAGLAVKKAVGAAGTAAGTAAAAKAAFVGPLQAVSAGPGPGIAAGTGGVFAGMSPVGIAGVVTFAALWTYGMFNKLFPKSDPEQEAIDRQLQGARDRGEWFGVANGIVYGLKVTKSQLKAPVR
jgi:hypothetical protein